MVAIWRRRVGRRRAARSGFQPRSRSVFPLGHLTPGRARPAGGRGDEPVPASTHHAGHGSPARPARHPRPGARGLPLAPTASRASPSGGPNSLLWASRPSTDCEICPHPTPSALPPRGDQLLEKSIHRGVEKLHPRNGSVRGHGFGGRPLTPLFLTAAANTGVARFGHVKMEPPNPTGQDVPPTGAPYWSPPALGASDWRQRDVHHRVADGGGEVAGG